MAQRHINYGAFPDDLNADAIRAAFQKSEDNFTELFTGAATAGVSRIIAGPGITLQGSSTGTGNVTVAASLNAINVVTDESRRNLIVQGSPLVNSQQAISINLNPNLSIENLDVNTSITLRNQQLFSFDANDSIVFGSATTRINGEFISNVISQPYQDPNAGPIVPGQVQFSSQLGNGQNIITGSQAFRFDNVSNTVTMTNATVIGSTTLASASMVSATITSSSDSNIGNTSQGALVVTGGLGVQRSMSIGTGTSNHTVRGNITVPEGNIVFQGSTPAVALGQGTLIVTGTGGGSIGGNLFVGGSLSTTGSFSLSNSAITTQPGEGALVIPNTGGTSIGGNIEIGGYANIGANADIAGNTNIGGTANITGDANVTGNINVTASLAVEDNIVGNVIQANIDIIGPNYFSANLTQTIISSSDNTTITSNTTTISSNTTIQQAFEVFGNSRLSNVEILDASTLLVNGNINSSNTTSGSMIVSGGVGISGDIYIGANANITGNLYLENANLIVANANANISARGSNTQIQYNNFGNLAGSANFTWNNTNSNLRVAGNANVSTLLSTNVQASYTFQDGAIQFANTGASPVSGIAVLRSSTDFYYQSNISRLFTSNATISNNFRVSDPTTTPIFDIDAVGNTIALSAPTTVSNNITISGNLTTGNMSVVTFAGPTLNAPNANIQFRSLGVGTAASGTQGEIRATNDITAFYTSDRQYKENFKPIDNALDKAAAISGYFFDWTDEHIANRGGEDGYFVSKQDIGVIAQEVQPHIPQAVKTRPDGSLAVDYPKLVALCLAALAEVKQELDKLKGK